MHRILVESDYHAGHLLGLTPPDWWTERTRPWAEPLWEARKAYLEQLPRVDDHILNGDLIDGPGKKDTAAHLTTDVIEQIEMAEQAALMPRAKRRWVVKGTGFHTDNGGALETPFARAIGTTAEDELRLEIYGRKLHSRHVVGRSDVPYGQYTQLGKELINDLLQAEMEGYEAADILIRSHVHYTAHISVADGVRGIMRHAITTPALQLRGPLQSEYTRKLRTWLYHVGALLIEIDKTGEVFLRPHIIPIKLTAPTLRKYTCLTA